MFELVTMDSVSYSEVLLKQARVVIFLLSLHGALSVLIRSIEALKIDHLALGLSFLVNSFWFFDKLRQWFTRMVQM